MPEGSEHFSLAYTVSTAGNALIAIVCRIGFEAAVHGLIIAVIVLLVALVQSTRKQKYARPLVSVFRKLVIFCVLLGAPGVLCLVACGKLPAVNSLELNSVGLLGFWALVTLHLCMEEMNFQWFGEARRVRERAEDGEIEESVPRPVVRAGKK